MVKVSRKPNWSVTMVKVNRKRNESLTMVKSNRKPNESLTMVKANARWRQPRVDITEPSGPPLDGMNARR